MTEIKLGPGAPSAADAELLDAFYRDVYLPAFAHQREPVEAWHAQLAGRGGPHALSIVLAGDALDDPARRRLDGGIVYERYPASGCGLVTYLVVAPHARRGGLGARLLARARADLAGAPLVLAEISDPAGYADDPAAHAAARRRLAFFEARGARVLDVPYVQPDLGAGLGRDRHLLLVAFFDRAAAAPATVDGAALRAFLGEFFATVEGAAAARDPEVVALLAAIGPAVGVRAPDAAAARAP